MAGLIDNVTRSTKFVSAFVDVERLATSAPGVGASTELPVKEIVGVPHPEFMSLNIFTDSTKKSANEKSCYAVPMTRLYEASSCTE